MLKGLRVDPWYFETGLLRSQFTLGAATPGAIDLQLSRKLSVTALYQDSLSQTSPYLLKRNGKKDELVFQNHLIPIRLRRHPDFYDQKLTSQMNLRDVATVHGSYVSLALGGHRYLQNSILSAEGSSLPLISVEQTITLLRRIQREQVIHVVSLSSWDDAQGDGGLSQVRPYIEAIKKHFRVLVYVELQLPQKEEVIDHSYAIGADSVCYHIGNLCSHHADHVADHAPRDFERERQLLSHAVSGFPQGRVLAHITVGALGNRSNDSSKKEIDAFCALGVLPVLTFEDSVHANQRGLTAQQAAEIFLYTYECAKTHRIKMGWFSELAPFFSPAEARLLKGNDSKIKQAVDQLVSPFVGGALNSSMANMRRKLRVKKTDEDFSGD